MDKKHIKWLFLFFVLISMSCERSVYNLSVEDKLADNIVVDGFIFNYQDWNLDIEYMDVYTISPYTSNPALLGDEGFGIARNKQSVRISKTVGTNTSLAYGLTSKYSAPSIMDVSDIKITDVTDTNAPIEHPLKHVIHGIYSAVFVATAGHSYELSFTYEGNTYKAQTTIPELVVKIKTITAEGIDDKSTSYPDEYENFEYFLYYDDPAGIENYYYWRTFETSFSDNSQPEKWQIRPLYIAEDGIQETVYSDDIFEEGSQNIKRNVTHYNVPPIFHDGNRYILNVLHHDIDKDYYDFLKLFVNIAIEGNDTDISATPARVKGNIENTTNPNKLAFGYFFGANIQCLQYTIQK